MCNGAKAGSYSRLTYFVSLNSRLESHKEEEERCRSVPHLLAKPCASQIGPFGFVLLVQNGLVHRH